MAFEQAAIKVEKSEEFGKLQGAIAQAFAADEVERLLRQAERKRIRIRDFEAALKRRVFEGFGEPGLNAQQLYQSLVLSDQAQIREFYLSKLETVEPALRHKFKRLYQYY